MILAHLPYFLRGEGVFTTTRCRSFYGAWRVTIICVGVNIFHGMAGCSFCVWGDFRFQISVNENDYHITLRLLVKRIVII